MVVVESVKDGKVIAITARTKNTTKTVTVGRGTLTFDSGRTRTFVVRLNAIGERLLTEHHSLKVKVDVAESDASISRSTLDFKARSKHASVARREFAIHRDSLRLRDRRRGRDDRRPRPRRMTDREA